MKILLTSALLLLAPACGGDDVERCTPGQTRQSGVTFSVCNEQGRWDGYVSESQTDVAESGCYFNAGTWTHICESASTEINCVINRPREFVTSEFYESDFILCGEGDPYCMAPADQCSSLQTEPDSDLELVSIWKSNDCYNSILSVEGCEWLCVSARAGAPQANLDLCR